MRCRVCSWQVYTSCSPTDTYQHRAAAAAAMPQSLTCCAVHHMCPYTCRQLGACEFLDDEHYCSLEALLVQLGCKEVVLPRAPDGATKATPTTADATQATPQGTAGGVTQGGAVGGGILPGGADARRLRDVVMRVGALASDRPSKAFGTKNLEQDLGRLLKVGP